jgi:hypothetical protein
VALVLGALAAAFGGVFARRRHFVSGTTGNAAVSSTRAYP